jgi:hypothetical protein
MRRPDIDAFILTELRKQTSKHLIIRPGFA